MESCDVVDFNPSLSASSPETDLWVAVIVKAINDMGDANEKDGAEYFLFGDKCKIVCLMTGIGHSAVISCANFYRQTAEESLERFRKKKPKKKPKPAVDRRARRGLMWVLERVRNAPKESPIAVFFYNDTGIFDTFFANTIKTQEKILDCALDFVGIFHGDSGVECLNELFVYLRE